MARLFPITTEVDGGETITATAAELETLTDGSNADALHVHAGGGGALQGETWLFNTATGDVDPGGGAFRVNNADQSLATQAFVDDIANNSAPTGANGLSQLGDGDILYIEQQDDSTRFAVYLITASNIVGAPNYQKVQISAIANGSALELNKACTFRIFKAPRDGGIGFSVTEIQAAETVTIPVRRQMIVVGDFTNNGDLIVDGDFANI